MFEAFFWNRCWTGLDKDDIDPALFLTGLDLQGLDRATSDKTLRCVIRSIFRTRDPRYCTSHILL